MTEDEAYQAMATASGHLDAAGWQDFCSLPSEQQQAVAALYKNAIFSAAGASAWTALLGVLSTAATIFGDASGIGTAFFTLKGLV